MVLRVCLTAMERRLSVIKRFIKLRKGKVDGAGFAPDSVGEETVGVVRD
jgi:hypothetical protein